MSRSRRPLFSARKARISLGVGLVVSVIVFMPIVCLLVENEFALAGDFQPVDCTFMADHDLALTAKDIRALDDPHLRHLLLGSLGLFRHCIVLFSNHFALHYPLTRR
jgi:hypothetical protein